MYNKQGNNFPLKYIPYGDIHGVVDPEFSRKAVV